jgi:transposase
MPNRIRLRTLTKEEEQEIRRLAKSRTESIRIVQRAKIIAAMLDNPELADSRAGEQAGFKGAPMGVEWVKRFNERGIAGLVDGDRPGRPPTHSQATRSALLDLALQKPRRLGYPFELWTWNDCALSKNIRAAFIGLNHLEWVEGEGFRWRNGSWFHTRAARS